MLAKHHEQNLDTLSRAFAAHQTAVVECRRRSDGQTVAMLCAVGFDGKNYGITPFAEMVNGNPFEMYDPPNPDGGFYED